MDENEKLKKVDFEKDHAKIPEYLRQYMKIIEKQNLERVQKLRRIRRNNIITGCLLGTGVLGIYAYSMLAVKQENFLDDFEEPKMITTPSPSS